MRLGPVGLVGVRFGDVSLGKAGGLGIILSIRGGVWSGLARPGRAGPDEASCDTVWPGEVRPGAARRVEVRQGLSRGGGG